MLNFLMLAEFTFYALGSVVFGLFLFLWIREWMRPAVSIAIPACRPASSYPDYALYLMAFAAFAFFVILSGDE